MQDILGNEFDIGDRVLFSRPTARHGGKHCIGRGTVEKITKTRISIRIDENFSLADRRMAVAVCTKLPQHFLRLDKAGS